MRKLLRHIPAFYPVIFFCLTLASCQREIDPGPGPGPGPGGVDDNTTVMASVRGVVVNEMNLPVEGATVSSGSYTTTTDRYGVFRFNNINISKNNGFIKVKKSGYFNGNRSFVTTAGRTHNVRLKLLPKSVTGSFAGSSGGTVNITGGAKVNIPAGSVTDASGATYSGTVNVSATWIDPSASNLAEIIVGDLRGITTGNEERALETYGMIGVELTGSGGQALKISTGKTAEITFPIPASLMASAPATIDLWHFDETKGRWMQEGTATKTGSNYVGTVSHFSFWNADVPFPLVDLCMKLVNAADNQPLNNVQVRIRRGNGNTGTAWTDSAGNICGKVPKNEGLMLEVLDQCNQVAYTQAIGPFSGNTNLGTISVTLGGPNTVTITGTLKNCANSNVTNGAVTVYTGNSYSYIVPVTNGSFSFTLIKCGTAPISFSVKGVDLSTLQESLVYTGTGNTGTVNIGDLQACGNVTEFIEYIINGVPHTWVDLGGPNEVFVMDSVATGGFITKSNVFAQWVVNNNAETTYFSFKNNETPGTYPLDGSNMWDIKVEDPLGNTWALRQIVSPNPQVNITAFGPTGGYIEGNFNVMMGPNPTPVNVVCHFKVKR